MRIDVGRDYWDVVPIKGSYRGGATEAMIVEVELEELETAPADGHGSTTRR